MAEPTKFEYKLDLSSPQLVEAAQRNHAGGGPVIIRSIGPDDAEILAPLLLEGYRNTIDYEGEELAEAIDAIADFFADEPRLDASMLATVDGIAASAVLMTTLDGGPFLSLVFTNPAQKRTGLARRVVVAACQHLAASGEVEVRFAITDGNTASERLFAELGAIRAPRDRLL